MKILITFLFVCFMPFTALAQSQAGTGKYDLSTIDGTIEALYASISGEKGAERDWETFRMLFRDGAKLMPAGSDQKGNISVQYWTPEEYIKQAGSFLVKNGFFEKEIQRKTDLFDPIAHVFSTYISRNTEGGKIIARGINSIQLLNDGERWWVVNIYWIDESDGREIPEEYDNN